MWRRFLSVLCELEYPSVQGSVRWSKGQSAFDRRAEMDKEQDTSVPSTTIDTFIPGICTIYRTWDKVHSEIKGKVQDYI